MEVSPKTFREVEFREKLRGYHPEDVDQFLEQMAAGVEVLQDRLRQAVERAQRAEQMAAEAGTSDETLRRTLVLAQRTADLAVQEAREQAARIVSSAEQKAQAMLTDAEERARKLHNEALADVHAELGKLEATRSRSQQEVDGLERWAAEQRAHLIGALQDALEMLDGGGLTSPPPRSTPLEAPRAPAAGRPAPLADPSGSPLTTGGSGQAAPAAPPPIPGLTATIPAVGDTSPVGGASPVGGPNGTSRAAPSVPAPAEGAQGQRSVGDPPPAAGMPPLGADVGASRREQDTGAHTVDVASPSGYGAPRPPDDEHEDGPDEEALDNFFHGDEYGDDRRFGGRLRRRR